MKWMSSYITIGNYAFDQRVSKVVIDSSRKTLTDKATIHLPNYGKMLSSTIAVGQEVKISLGYNGQLRDEFVGYVASISPKVPFIIECEDEMWKLKQQKVDPVSWKETTLANVISYLVPGVQLNVPDVTLTGYRITGRQTSVARVLSDLKKQFGLDVYMRNQTLFVGLALTEDVGDVVYHFQKNLPFQQEDLVFLSKDAVKIKVKATSLQPDNKRIDVEVGDPDGEQHTLHFYNISESELKTLAEEKIRLLKFDGYRGKLKAKGQPLPIHGMVAHIIDEKHPERTGKYFIDSVYTVYDESGFNRTIKPGFKA